MLLAICTIRFGVAVIVVDRVTLKMCFNWFGLKLNGNLERKQEARSEEPKKFSQIHS